MVSYFHVVVTEARHSEAMLDLDEAAMMERYVSPWVAGETLMANGRPVRADSVVQMKVFESTVSSADLKARYAAQNPPSRGWMDDYRHGERSRPVVTVGQALSLAKHRTGDYLSKPPSHQRRSRSTGSAVFIVHGHDDHMKEATARRIEGLGLKAVILHEQPDRNLTIIEKFEQHADVSHAVVLFSPDDLVLRPGGSVQARARQNVVFELGYFIGRLGRRGVTVLHTGDIEIPSDYSGVLYVPFDSPGAWKYKLAEELAAAGLPLKAAEAVGDDGTGRTR